MYVYIQCGVVITLLIVVHVQNKPYMHSLPPQEIYQTVSFSNVVVIRESLLPLLKAIGIPTAPQLRASCHNQRQLHVDCSLTLREGTVFVMEPFSSCTLPALSVERAAVMGHLQASWDSPTTQLPTLSLLSSSTENTHSLHSSKRTINGHFSTQAGVVSVGVTVPLMKLCRHLIETSRILSHGKRPTKPPKPTTIPTNPPHNVMDSPGQPLHPSADIWQFAQELVGQLTALQREALQNAARQSEGNVAAIPSCISLSRPSSTGSRSVRSIITDFSHSPKNVTVNSPSSVASHHLSPPAVSTTFTVPRRQHTHSLSNDSSTSEVAIQIEHVDAPLATSPASQSPMDTSGGDLASSDDVQLSPGSHKVPSSPLPPAAPLEASAASQTTEWLGDTLPLQRTLETPTTQLSHSMFGLLLLDFLSFTLQVETSTTSLRLAGESSGCLHDAAFTYLLYRCYWISG